MKLVKIKFSYIRSYRSLSFDFDNTKVLIGQNDHGKSSILKVLNIIFNEVTEEMISKGIFSPDIAEKLLTIFNTNAKARRISLLYSEKNQDKFLHISIKPNFTFLIHEKVSRTNKTTNTAKKIFHKIRDNNKFILIPALRDTTSETFKALFANTLDKYGLSNIIPQKAGGTTREYRKLKNIKKDIQKTIKPFVDEALIPQISNALSFEAEHPLALSFDADINAISNWIRDNLKLSFQLDEGETATLPLSEAGSGIQSAILLALNQLDFESSTNPDKNYFFAIEEPESFLHPQKQKELYQNIKDLTRDNVYILLTTHSPFIVAETNFSDLGLIRKSGKFSTFHTPKIIAKRDKEIYNSYSTEVNSLMFFSDKVIFVEGESDKLVIEVLLKKYFNSKAWNYSIISASGNKNFSPYIRMIRSWENLSIPHLIVTDFDSLTQETDRAILRGLKDSGIKFKLQEEQSLHQKIDSVLTKSNDSDYENVAININSKYKTLGANLFVFTSDLEYSLIDDFNRNKVINVMNESSNTNFSSGYNNLELKRHIGSKGIPFNPFNQPKLKKPFIHKKIAETIDINNCSNDISRLLNCINDL